ncbi:diguanylate cyclase [Methylorubrum aminovorans]
MTDTLTGLPNRRRFEQDFERVLKSAQRTGKPVSLLVVDADHFKRYNDRHGHTVGDAVLKVLARHLSESVHRPDDLVARVGGEEFVVMLPDTDADGALRIAAKIHQAVTTLDVPSAGIGAGAVTVSIGLATGPGAAEEQAEALYRAADAALYEAKAGGRNQTRCAAPAGGGRGAPHGRHLIRRDRTSRRLSDAGRSEPRGFVMLSGLPDPARRQRTAAPGRYAGLPSFGFCRLVTFIGEDWDRVRPTGTEPDQHVNKSSPPRMTESATPEFPLFLAGGGLMGAMMRCYDWSGSPLGHPDAWPPCLRSTVSLLLGSRFPMFAAFGPQLGFLYNDAYAEILGGKHPAALGGRFRDIWCEIWTDIAPLIEKALAGEPTWSADMPLTMNRRGYDELTWFTFSYSPVRDEHGEVAGMFCACTETTGRVQAEAALRANGARLQFLDQLGKETARSTDADEILATTTRMVAEHLNLSNCAYADMDPDQNGFTIRGDWAAEGSPSIVGHYSLADFGRRAVEDLGAGRPLVINDNLAELAPEEAATFQAIGIAATICMPLVKDGRLTALMAIHDRVSRTWSDYDLALITEVTERSWAHIERVRAVAKLEALNATLEQRVEERTSKLVETEAVLRQSQKLEAVGQLTGGVAHDFNNLLTIIRSSVDFLRRPDLPDERKFRYLNAVTETVDRASKLTSQLLAFARRQTLKPETLDVGARLRAIGDLLDTVTGARIKVVTDLPDQPCFIEVDLSQFETALVNMAVNARDAMDGEGTLTLRLECCVPLPPIRGHAGAPGPFAAVSLGDTGCGIPSDLLSRVFEPFFTTKEVGKGTGLGLSQVFGFAKQSGGDVKVESVLGQGTTFTLYLPEVQPEVSVGEHDVEAAEVDLGGAGQRVLVVEDNVEVGRFTTQILEDLGYATTWAGNAEEALDKLGASGADFDVVFSDVVMPGMGGIELAKLLRRQLPHLPVVLASGYSHVLAQEGSHGFELLQKPYSADQVSRVLRRALARKHPRAASRAKS